MIVRLVSNPRAFVERQSKYPGIRTQSIIVAAVGLLFSVQHLGNIVLLEGSLGHVSAPIWVMTLLNVGLAFLLWAGVTIIIYFVARLFKGYCSIGHLFNLVGWGLAPLAVAGLVRSLGVLYLVRDAPAPVEPEFSSFQNELESYQTYLDPASTDPVLLLSIMLAVPFVLFTGYIWTLVVAHIGDIERREAAIVSAIPTGLCLVWVASPLL